jgi:hypothetical protein
MSKKIIKHKNFFYHKIVTHFSRRFFSNVLAENLLSKIIFFFQLSVFSYDKELAQVK